MAVAPDFDHPPVVEMALGVQFQPLLGLRGLALAPLRELWRGRYPMVQEVPPLPPSFERPVDQAFGVQLAFGPVPSVRYWFLSEDSANLIQVQNDRLIVNWRSTSDEASYPRYEVMRAMFEARAHDLADFVEAEGLGRIEITQVEANYINARDPGSDGLGMPAFLRAWAGTAEHHLGNPVEARINLAFDVPDIGRPPVRLHVAVEPAPGPQVSRQFMTLTVRGAPADTRLETSVAFLDEAHDHLNASFLELTPTAMHGEWGFRG